MERLTRRTNGVVVYIGAKNPYSTGQIPCEVEPAGVREMMDRLAAYEDTGRTPEEVTALGNLFDYALEESKTLTEQLALLNRLRELAEADKDGRLVVSPCKPGDTVWVTGRDNVPREMELEAPDIRAVCTDEDNLCMSTCNRKPDGFCAYRLRNDGADIGKTVFLTREEAEKALEAMKNEIPGDAGA
jgi:hypothetical protein